MPSFYLVPYSIRMKDLENDKYIKLGDKGEWGDDFLDLLHSYLEKEMPSMSFDPEDKNKKTIRPEKFSKEDRIVVGMLKAGEYGFESDLHDVEVDETKYARQTNDAELIPYFFLTKIPSTTTNGIALFQRIGNRGFKDVFEKDLNHYIQGKFSSQYRIEISPLLPRDMVKRYLENRIVKIRLIKYGFPKEVSDVDLSGIPNEEQGEAEFTLKAHRNQTFPDSLLGKLRGNIDSFLGDGDSSVGSVLEIKDFQADNVKIEVRIGNSYRTIDLSNIDRLKFSEDITDRVKLNPDSGHPEFEDLKKVGIEFLNDCAEALWGEGSNEKSTD